MPEWKAIGTSVAAGEILTETLSESFPPPIAPAAGTVGVPVTCRLVDGRLVHGVELLCDPTPDGESAIAEPPVPSPEEAADLLATIGPADLGTWLGRLIALGVGASRWTSPDLIGQLRQGLRRPIDTVICSFMDSDPWLGIGRGVSGCWPLELAAGVGLLSRLTGAKQTWAMVDQAESPGTIAAMRQAASKVAKNLRIAPTENDYPQPDPTLLVYSATRRRLKPGRLPTEKASFCSMPPPPSRLAGPCSAGRR